MFNFLRYGPNKPIVKAMVWLSWPIIKAGKKWSAYPFLKWVINPFFAYPYNEVTAVPIGHRIQTPENMIIPHRVLERLISGLDDIFILNECVCRAITRCPHYPKDIGCMALGPAISRMHPSHGHVATREEAGAHVRKAAEAGLIANVAHTWIDPLAFGLTRFNRLMFICFCDDCCCIYRTHMKKRGPNLDAAYKKLPGISIQVDPVKCDGCGQCVDQCFVAAMALNNGRAAPSHSCKSCGRCVENCPQNAVSLHVQDENKLYEQLTQRIRSVADIWREPSR
jgi:UDP-glucose 4-epimerase